MAWTSGLFVVLTSVLFHVFLGFQIGDCGFVNDEENLRSALLSNYSVKVRPYLKTNIDILVYITSLNYLDIATQSMSVNTIFSLTWHDYRLTWNSTDYGGLDNFVTAPEDIWTPPIVIENAVADLGVIGGKDRDATPVRITSDGMVLWTPPSEVSTSCEMLIAQYPFDTQNCAIVLLGWTYPLSEMNASANGIDTVSLYSVHGDFDLKTARSYYSDVIAQNTTGEKNTYRKLSFEFTFRRKWQFYGQNLLMPIVLNSVLMNAVFALPIESGEKMGFSLTVLLSYTVFLTWVTENLPPVSTDTSILQVYLAVVLCLGCLATLLTTWVLHLYHTSPEKPMSRFYRKFASTILVPFFNLNLCAKKKQKVTHGDDLDPPHYVNKATPVPSRSTSVTSLKLPPSPRLKTDVKIVDNSSKEVFGSDESEEEEIPTYTWQELASLFDHFFLWLLGVLLAIVTTVIFALLWSDY